MDILDQLLVSCHAHSLNLFVESFLKMVQKLLESSEPQMQIKATESFIKFANVEEDAPSYHRRYDFFVSKFSALCHNNHNNAQVLK
ncbi:protein EFR3, partial [Elysia marginata]